MLFGCVALLWFRSAATVHAQTRYHLTDLGVLPGRTNSAPAALNNAGQVAGSSDSTAFRYNGSPTLENLGTLPGGTTSTARGIDSAGRVVGSSNYTNSGAIQHAVLFNGDGTATDLGTLSQAGTYSFALAINASAQVVGYSSPRSGSTNTRAFLWDSVNGMRDIGTLGGQYARAFSINDAGFVTGASQVPNSFGAFHAFLYDAAGGMRDLGTLAGSSSNGASINASGHVVGSSTINNFDNRDHAFLHDGATMHDLGSLGPDDFYSDRSAAYGINASDTVVGSTYLPYGGGALQQVAFVYRDGVMRDLNTLLDESSRGYRLGSAVAINDAGQIVAHATKLVTNDNRAVLLTPVPTFRSIVREATTGVVSLAGVGMPSRNMAIEATDDLTQPFTLLGKKLTQPDGTFEFSDTPPENSLHRYYRATYP